MLYIHILRGRPASGEAPDIIVAYASGINHFHMLNDLCYITRLRSAKICRRLRRKRTLISTST